MIVNFPAFLRLTDFFEKLNIEDLLKIRHFLALLLAV